MKNQPEHTSAFTVGTKVIYANGMVPRHESQQWPGFGDTGTIVRILPSQEPGIVFEFEVEWDRPACEKTWEYLKDYGYHRSTCWTEHDSSYRIAYQLARLSTQPKMQNSGRNS